MGKWSLQILSPMYVIHNIIIMKVIDFTNWVLEGMHKAQPVQGAYP